MKQKKQFSGGGSSGRHMDIKDEDMSIRKIMKEIEFFTSSHMTWKEKKEVENKKVVSLGGKPVKKQRRPLSVALGPMKKRKEREQKMLQEHALLGLSGSKSSAQIRRAAEKRKPEDMVLKSSEGIFRRGTLDVKHLLRPQHTPTRDDSSNSYVGKRGKGKKGKGKKQGGKKKGGGKRQH
ncbi:Protein of unknown function DUF4602 [Dillenia turbinata]|uniref:Axoneme-associated protein MST101(2) protein n=1 Tax=Dillenia turbinata TaxID=194707 RepID=A0AAN8U9N5_9MAGN